MVSKDDVIRVLKRCYDPEIPINVYDLGLIYDISIFEGGRVAIKMTLTAPGCPMAQSIAYDVQEKVKTIGGVSEVDVDVVWDPPWTPERMSDEAKNLLGV